MPAQRIRASEPPGDARDLIRTPRRGEILVGGLRMCLIDVGGGFGALRKAMEEFIGPVTRTVLSNAGTSCGRRFAEEAIRQGLCPPGEAAFAFCVDSYAVAGFGGFEIREVRLEDGRAVVACRDPAAFEAEPFLHEDGPAKEGVCDYTRGVFAGFLAVASGRDDALAIETACRAKGDAECVFEVGPEDAILARYWVRP
jgi:predicted hydrocarbon binding protein